MKLIYKNTAIVAIIMVLMLLGSYPAFAGGVTDNNNGNKGDIFVSTGENHGANSVGTWTDSSVLKGEKGDNGFDGYTPIKGIDYNDGLDGLNGENGYTPIKGVDYFDGNNGMNGESVKGDKGNDGESIKGDKGDQGSNGESVKGDAGVDGKAGVNGKDVNPSTVNTLNKTDANLNAKANENTSKIDDMNKRLKGLERTQYVVEPEIRLTDTRKTSISTFVRYNIGRRKLDIVGVRFTYKMGSSYEERQLKELEARIEASMEAQVKRLVSKQELAASLYQAK